MARRNGNMFIDRGQKDGATSNRSGPATTRGGVQSTFYGYDNPLTLRVPPCSLPLDICLRHSRLAGECMTDGTCTVMPACCMCRAGKRPCRHGRQAQLAALPGLRRRLLARPPRGPAHVDPHPRGGIPPPPLLPPVHARWTHSRCVWTSVPPRAPPQQPKPSHPNLVRRVDARVMVTFSASMLHLSFSLSFSPRLSDASLS
jgi:hypothetical protein